MVICPKCQIVYDNRYCPLCALRTHDNLVHDFIESKGRPFVSELVAYLNRRETAESIEPAAQSGEAPVQHTQLAIPARAVVNHWDEFGPEFGFDETVECLRMALKQQAGA